MMHRIPRLACIVWKIMPITAVKIRPIRCRFMVWTTTHDMACRACLCKFTLIAKLERMKSSVGSSSDPWDDLSSTVIICIPQWPCSHACIIYYLTWSIKHLITWLDMLRVKWGNLFWWLILQRWLWAKAFVERLAWGRAEWNRNIAMPAKWGASSHRRPDRVCCKNLIYLKACHWSVVLKRDLGLEHQCRKWGTCDYLLISVYSMSRPQGWPNTQLLVCKFQSWTLPSSMLSLGMYFDHTLILQIIILAGFVTTRAAMSRPPTIIPERRSASFVSLIGRMEWWVRSYTSSDKNVDTLTAISPLCSALL